MILFVIRLVIGFLFLSWLFKTLWFFSIVPIFGMVPLTFGQAAALLGLIAIVATAFKSEFKLDFKRR